MPPPYVAQVARVIAERTPNLSPIQVNDRFFERIDLQQAPDPVRYGDTPARRARMPLYSALSKGTIRAVMAIDQAGVIPKTQFDIAVGNPEGKSLAWNERVNIRHDYPVAYGTHFTVDPQTDDEAELRLMLGA